jgi:uncharacterized protein YndB with AHSA1/START domain
MTFPSRRAVLAVLASPGCSPSGRNASVPQTSDKPVESIQIERFVEAPIERVWHAWIDPADLSRWLTERANIQPEVGGAYELFWEPDHPDRNSTMGCKITAIDNPRLLTFTWRGPVQFSDFMNSEPPPTHVRIELASVDGRTRVQLTHAGWGPGPRWAEARAWFDRAWNTSLDRLATILSSPASTTPPTSSSDPGVC